MRSLMFMGREDWAEPFRGRIYGGDGSSATDESHVRFIRELGTTGIVECPAYDKWLEALDARGYLTSALEPNPSGDGRVCRWRLNSEGREEFAKMLNTTTDRPAPQELEVAG